MEDVSSRGQAWVNGILSTFPGCALIAKHFPGYNVARNSDVQAVEDRHDRAFLMERMRPFLAVRGLSGIMMSSIIYPAFGNVAALFSSELIEMIHNANPDLVVMTDDIAAPSLVPQTLTGDQRRNAMAEVALRAFRAGCDMILAMDGPSVRTITNFLTQSVEADSTGVLKQRLVNAYGRVRKMRQNLMTMTSQVLPQRSPRLIPSEDLPAVNDAEACITDRLSVSRAERAALLRGMRAFNADGVWTSVELVALQEFQRQNRLAVSRCLTRTALTQLEARIVVNGIN